MSDQASLRALKAIISTITSEVDTLETTVSTLNSEVDTNTASVAQLTSDVSALTSQVNTNTSSTTDLGTRMNTAEDEIDALQADNTTNTTSIGSLQTRVTTAETNITGLDTRLDAAEADISALQAGGGTSELNTRMTTAEGEIDALQADNTTNKTNIGSLQTRMTTAEGEIDTLQADKNKIHNLPVVAPISTDDGKVLSFNNTTQSYEWVDAPTGGGGGGGGTSDSALVKTVTVGANTDTIDITSLDINTHEGYIVIADLKNATASSQSIHMYVNTDYTDSNYVYHLVWSGGGGSGTAPVLGAVLASDTSLFRTTVDRSAQANQVILHTVETRLSDNTLLQWGVKKTTTDTNVTSLRIKSTVAGGIAAGSTVKVYKRKVSGAVTSGGTLTESTSVYTATGGESNIPVGVAGFSYTSDLLMVFEEGVRLYKGVHFNIAANGTSIDLIGETAIVGNEYLFSVVKLA